MTMGLIDILALASLVLFYGLFFGRTVLLYRRGIKVWVIGSSTKSFYEKALENILVPVLIGWSLLLVLAALRVDMPPLLSRPVFDIRWARYAGIGLCYAGLVIFLAALVSFGKAWRIGIDERNSNELITSGIFRYSRNPIFLFMDIYFIGVVLVYPTVVFIAIAAGTIIGVHLQILREEKFLLAKFGGEYAAYKKRTRRYA